MMDYKIPYLLKRFNESDLIEDPDLIVEYLTDKYDNNNTINGYIFSIIRFVKENAEYYDRQDVKRAYRKYFNYINNKQDISDDEDDDDIKTKCLIVDDDEPVGRPVRNADGAVRGYSFGDREPNTVYKTYTVKNDVRDLFKGSNDMPDNLKRRRF
jgi:hypothetical protein